MSRIRFFNREIKDDGFMGEIKNDDINYMKKLIKDHPDKINRTNSWGQTYLMAACRWGKADLISMLIDAGAGLDMRDDINGSTALHYAVWWRQLQAVTILITRGSDVNRKENDGWTPLHLAAAIMGKEWKDGVSALLQIRGKNMIEVNQRDNYFHRTPLHVACFWGHTDTVRSLLNQKGIDANMVDDDGNSPLHLAVQVQRYDVVVCMLSQDSVQLNIKNRNKMTALLEAVTRGHLGMTDKLIARGADVNAVNHEGNNCLHLAMEMVFHSEIEPLSILNEYCTELSLTKTERLSGVVAACYLAHQGANFYRKNKKGITPLDLLQNGDLKEKIVTLFPPQHDDCGHAGATPLVEEIDPRTYSLCRRCLERTVHPCQHSVLFKDKYSEMACKRCPTCQQNVISESRLETPELTEKFLQNVAQQLGVEWQQVGRNLGMKDFELKIIKSDNPNSTIEQGFQMLHKWFIRSNPGTRTFNTLRDALEAAKCFDVLKGLTLEDK